MGRPGYLSYRVTETRRDRIDTLRRIMTMNDERARRRLDDAAVIDFALEWAACSMPPSFTRRQSALILRWVTAGGGPAISERDSVHHTITDRELRRMAEEHRAQLLAQPYDPNEIPH